MSAIEITTTTRANAPVPRASSRGLRNRLDAPIVTVARGRSERLLSRHRSTSRVISRHFTPSDLAREVVVDVTRDGNGAQWGTVNRKSSSDFDARASWRLFSAACAGSPSSCRTCETVAIRCARGRRARERRRRGRASEIFRWTSRVTRGRARARVRAREGTRRRDARGQV